MEELYPAKSPGEPLTLRDYLAIDRTALANERTLLGYLRTALALAVVGASALKFLASAPFVVLGWALLAAGAWMTWTGFKRFRRFKQRIDAARKQHCA